MHLPTPIHTLFRPVAPIAARYGVAFAAPMLLALVCIKTYKLPTFLSTGVFAPRLFELAATQAAAAVAASALVRAAVVFLLAAIATKIIARLRGAVPGARGYACGAVVAATALTLGVGLPADAPPPPTLDWCFAALDDLRVFTAFYWRDFAIATCIAVLAAWTGVKSSRARTVPLWVGVAAVALVAAIDAAYFATSRVDISVDELLWALESPLDSLAAARDGIAREPLVLASLPILAVPAGVVLATRLARSHATRDATAGGTRYPPIAAAAALGLLAWWSADALHDPRTERLAGNPVVRLASELASWPEALVLERATAQAPASRRVPVVDTRPAGLRAGPATHRHNVLVLLLESMRADATTVYSPSLPTTPFLAELARESLVVDAMYAHVPRTSCAWYAVITGRYPGTVSMMRRWLGGRNATAESSLARQLGALGYATGFFVPTRVDFENDAELLRALGFQRVVTREQVQGRSGEINSFGVEDRALLPELRTWLGARARAGQPFFATIMTNVGHFPYDPPRGWTRREFPGVPPQRAKYYNSVAYVDAFVRDVVEELRIRGLLDDTLLIVLGDHGEAFGEHGLVWHTGVPYETGLRVPAIVRLPAAERRVGRVSGLRQQFDIWPTIADALSLQIVGAKPPGRSLLGDDTGHAALFFATHFDGNALALRDGAMKYVYWYGRKPLEAYDLDTDPGESRNLAGTMPAGTRYAVEKDLRAWIAGVRASFAGQP